MIKQLLNKIPRWLIYSLCLFVITRIILTGIGLITIESTANLPPFPSHIFPYTSTDILNIWGHWDSNWYFQIAKHGYSSIKIDQGGSAGQANYAFFPLYPTLAGLLGKIIGNSFTAGIIISNLALFVSCYFIYKLTLIKNDEQTALRSIKYLFLFPTAFLFSSMLTESTFVALALGCYYFSRKGSWALAGILGFLTAMTRSIGVLLIIPALIEFFQMGGFRKYNLKVLWLLLIPTGLALFSIYNYYLSGDLLAFVHVQNGWGRISGNPIIYLAKGLFLKEGINSFFYALCALGGLASILLFWKNLRLSEWSIVFFAILVPLSSGLVSMPRYLLAAFPLFILCAKLGKDNKIDSYLTSAFALLQGSLVVFWVLGTYLIM